MYSQGVRVGILLHTVMAEASSVSAHNVDAQNGVEQDMRSHIRQNSLSLGLPSIRL